MLPETYHSALESAAKGIDVPPSYLSNHQFPLLVKQTYEGKTRYGVRSTCQAASIINAARLAGHPVADFQDTIIGDLRIPWDETSGGISVVHASDMAVIYREYTASARIDVPRIKTLEAVLSDLCGGVVYTASTGRNHSVVLYGIEKGNGGELQSVLVNPYFGKPTIVPWSRLLDQELHVDMLPHIVVGTTFAVR